MGVLANAAFAQKLTLARADNQLSGRTDVAGGIEAVQPPDALRVCLPAFRACGARARSMAIY